MNIIDIALLLIVGISVIFAVYRGFLASLLATIACLLSLVAALYAGPKLAESLARNEGVNDLMITFTDAGSLIGDSQLANTPISMIGEGTLDNILNTLSLPDALSDLLRQNVRNEAFADRGLSTINAYISATIVSVMLRAACFLICFFLGFLVLHILINLIDHVFYFPVLKHLNGLASGVLGALRGAMIVYALLILFPMLRSAIPYEPVEQIIGQSRLLPLLFSNTLFQRVIGM